VVKNEQKNGEAVKIGAMISIVHEKQRMNGKAVTMFAEETVALEGLCEVGCPSRTHILPFQAPNFERCKFLTLGRLILCFPLMQPSPVFV
jgi:hypothetical protein